MSPVASTRNTHTPSRFEDAPAALAAISGAGTLIGLGQSLERFCAALELSHYLLLHIDSVGTRLCGERHNLGEAANTEAVLRHPLTRRLLTRPLPFVIPEEARGLGIPAITAGIAVAMPAGARMCALFLGRPGPAVDEEAHAPILGLTTVAANLALQRLKRLAIEDCPLSTRELECLSYAAAGLSAKQAARRLNISHRTVEGYHARCRTRLGVESTFAASVLALRSDWLTHEQIEAHQSECAECAECGPSAAPGVPGR